MMAENYEIKQVPIELSLEEIRRVLNELNTSLRDISDKLDDHETRIASLE